MAQEQIDRKKKIAIGFFIAFAIFIILITLYELL
jgi:hypothetical protein